MKAIFSIQIYEEVYERIVEWPDNRLPVKGESINPGLLVTISPAVIEDVIWYPEVLEPYDPFAVLVLSIGWAGITHEDLEEEAEDLTKGGFTARSADSPPIYYQMINPI